jgi:phage N-6-adenine-methyltransferase
VGGFAVKVVKPTGASLARHRSDQDVETPEDFMRAVVRRFGPIAVDLAATVDNAKARRFLTPQDNALEVAWSLFDGNLWLNPPFGDISPWATHCRAWTDAHHKFDRILMLVPASVGSKWFAKHVHGQAMVLALTGRLTFVGHTHPFPKDLILVEWGRFVGFDCWDWRLDAF